MKAKLKKSWSISLVRGTVCDIHFSIAGNIIPTVREQQVKSLGQLHTFPLTDRHRRVKYRGLSCRVFTPLRGVRFQESSRHGASSMASYPAFCGPCRPMIYISHRLRISSSTSPSTLASGWVWHPASQQLASILQLEYPRPPFRPSPKNWRLAKLGSTWCFGTHQMMLYAMYSLASR